MAVQTDALDVVLRLIGAKSFQAGVNEAKASLAGFTREVKRADVANAGLKERTMLVGSALNTFAKVGLVAAGVATADAIKQSIAFQKEMTMLQTQAGASAADVKELSKQVLELAKIRPQGPQELAKGLYHFQSLFQNSKAAFEGLQVASQGAAIGNANLEDTSTALGAAMRAVYGPLKEHIPTFQEMKQTMAELNSIVGVGNMRMDQLSLALGTNVVPAAITAGYTLKDVGGALAVLTDEGQRADNAATHLRMAMILLGAHGKLAQEQLKSIGINPFQLETTVATSKPGEKLFNALNLIQTQLNKKYPLLGPRIANIHNYQDALNIAKQFQTITKAFGGARSSATIMQLMNNMDVLHQKTHQVKTGVKALDNAFAAWSKTSDAKVRTSLSDLQSSLVEFGNAIRDHAVFWITKVIKVGSFLIQHIDTWIPIMIAYVTAWKVLNIYLKLVSINAMRAEAALTQAMLEGTAGMVGLTDAMTVFGIELEALPIGWVITAIALLVIAIAMLIIHWKQVKHVAQDVWKWIKAHWGAAALIFAGLGQPWIAVIILIATHWKGFKKILEGVWHAIRQGWDFTVKYFKWRFGFMAGFIHGVINAFKAAVVELAKIYNAIPGFLRPTGKINIAGLTGEPTHPLIPGSTPIRRFQGPDATFGPANGIGMLPGGPFRQPSMRKPRAHVPDPVAVPQDPQLEVHNHLYLDGKEIFQSVTKQTAKKKARK